MTSQFKNPLPRKDQSASQSNEWLTGGPQPATSGDQPQETPSPTGQPLIKRGVSLVLPPWPSNGPAAFGPNETPQPASLADQSTVKQVSVQGLASTASAQMVPQTPGIYVQGGHGQYGVVPNGRLAQPLPGNGPQNIQGGPGTSQIFAPTQQAGLSVRPSSSALGPSPLKQLSAGASISMSGMGTIDTPSAPGTFGTDRPAWAGPLGKGPMGPMGQDWGKKGNAAPPPPDKKPGGKKRRKGRRFPIWARIVVGILTLMLILFGIGFGYYQNNFANALSRITGQEVQRAPGEENPNANLNGNILSGPRINILLLGSDTDEKFQGQYIAQTDIVVTIDPATKSVGMLSIPRDSFINVPGYGMHKLDEAYGLGGVKLSRLTIEQDFGITINYYAWVGLDGFIKVINEVGGVDVDVLHPIADDNYPDDVGSNNPYAVKRLYLSPGPQHLEGATALEYVRSRHADLVGDFGRSARQQQVLTALKTKLDNPNIFGKLSGIANDLVGYLQTDMQISDVLKLMNFARSLDTNSINKLILEPPYSSTGTAPADSGIDAGQSVVLPDCDKIIPAIAKMFQLGNNAACNISGPAGVGSSGNSSQPAVASAGSQQNQLLAAANVITGDAMNLSATASDTVSSLSSSSGDLFGIRSLLDLLLLGVFEAPDAFQL